MLAQLKRLVRPAKQFKWMKKRIEAERLGRILHDQNIDLFLDVGANMGQTGKEVRGAGYLGRIVSFEPVGKCHNRLMELSASDPNWTIFERCALGDAEGETTIHVSDATDLSSIAQPTAAMAEALPKVREQSVERVPVHTVDGIFPAIVQGARRPFLKIDAQGNDMAVLRGARDTIAKLAGIQIEMSLLPLYEGESLYLEILNLLDRDGFEAVMLVDRGYSTTRGRQLQVDGVFVRKPD